MMLMGGYKHLYKYRSLSPDSIEFTKDIIVNQQLYWPTSDQLNDPYENKPHIIYKPSFEEYISFYNRLMLDAKWASLFGQERHNAVARHMHERHKLLADKLAEDAELHRSKVSIISFAATAINRLLWRHYADAHKGICLQFTPALGSPLAVAMPVLYSDNRPVFNAATGMNPTTMILDFYLSKHSESKHEEEYRLFDLHHVGVKPFPEEDLTAVILGAKISNENKDLVRSWCSGLKKPPIVCQASLSKTNYDVQIENLPD